MSSPGFPCGVTKMTEVSPAGNSCSTETQGFQFCPLPTKVARDANSNIFINHGEITWNEPRKKWVGDKSHEVKFHRSPEYPIISWLTTYEELFWTGNVFDKAIPLSEMVDFLVDIWQDEGLYG